MMFQCCRGSVIRAALTLLLFGNIPVYAAGAEVSPPTAHQRVIGISRHENIRVVYDVEDNVIEAGIGKALYYVRGLLQAYRALGVKSDQIHVSVVVHGAAAYWLLKTGAYQKAVGDPFAFNPNEGIVQDLVGHGVSIELCRATMKAKGWTQPDVLPGVRIVHDGYTRIIDLENRGYAYIRF